MRISIFGLGYVGTVSAGCLARDGHTVVGVDPNQTKVDIINSGTAPIIEAEIDQIVSDAVKDDRLSATQDATQAIVDTEISLVCVGTPSRTNGSLDLSYVRNVCEEIGAAIKKKRAYHVLVMRSTMLPGSMSSVVIPTLEEAIGSAPGDGYGIAANPEFLREGTAVYDYYNPPKTVIGSSDDRTSDIVSQLYKNLPGPMIVTDVKTAEMVKYSDNVWHALKVSYANEIGNLCKRLGIDSHRVMDIFCQDTKLNLSDYYMRPGFAFGGSCLPKDVRALTHRAKTLDLSLPVIESILPSNREQIDNGFRMILDKGRKKIGILGFSFKAGTDDLRESPMVDIIEMLIGKGFDLRLFDKNVNLARLVGANRDYILNHIPHVAALMMESVEEVLEHADLIVIGNRDPDFKSILELAEERHIIVDLARVDPDRTSSENYDGICW